MAGLLAAIEGRIDAAVGWIDDRLNPLTWPQRLAGGVVPYVITMVTMVALAQLHSGFWLAVAALLLAAGVLWFHLFLNRPSPPPFAWHLVVAETSMLVGGAGLMVWARAGHPDGLGFVALVTLFVGVGELMAVLRQPHVASPARLIAAVSLLFVCIVAFTVGLSALGNGAIWPAIVCAVAVLLSPIPLALLSEELVDGTLLDEQPRRRVARWGGLAAAVVGAAVLSLGGAGWQTAVAVPIVLFVLVGAIASDTNTDVIAVAFLALVVFGNTPQPEPLTANLTVAKGDHVVVVFGDSYTSGEGAQHYFEDTNTPGVNTCRRSTKTYGANLTLPSTLTGDKTIFLACSGAVGEQLWLRSQVPKEPADWKVATGTSNLLPGLPQIASYQRHNDKSNAGANLSLTPDLVIVGIGGNDAKFGDIVQTCLAPGDCAKIGQSWIDHLTQDEPDDPSVRTAISTAFTKIRAAFPDTPVLVVPYPVPIAPHSCWWSPFSNDEHKFLNGFTNDLDAVQRQAAAKAGFMILDKMQTAFADHHTQICNGPRGSADVNLLARNSVRGTVEQSSNIQNWIHDSMHPNEKGQALMTSVVNEWLAQHPSLQDAPASASGTNAQVRSTAQIMGTDWRPCVGSGQACQPGATWIGGQFQQWFLRLLAPLFLIIGGCWAWWLATMKSARA